MAGICVKIAIGTTLLTEREMDIYTVVVCALRSEGDLVHML